ncbi:MAG: PASTA domain-containing protein, partial [Oscillospiraceae bacterium]|nr:PASTA domain-containing protein [Oscillospiraceae bacterium]
TTKRYYPYNNLASSVLGFVNDMNQGAYGLESYYNSILSGTSGRLVAARNGLSGDMPYEYQKLYEGTDGNSLVLTIDATIQQFLEKHLEIAYIEHDVQKYVNGIVMNVNTGEILAMSSKPDFDPNNPMEVSDPKALARLENLDGEEYAAQLQIEQQTMWRNKTISDPYEPGSVFKLVTASASLDTGAATVNSGYTCPGYQIVAGNRIRCWKHIGHGNLSFAEAIQRSCNPAFMQMGQVLGVADFSKYFDSFGLTEVTGIDLPGEAGSIYHAEQNMGIAELSSSAFGQTFKITPIQMITAASATINGGKLVTPYVVKQIVDSEKNIVESYEPQIKRQVISSETSEIMQEMGEIVVATEEGSGRNARIEGYRIGGKTGTGEKLDNYVNGEQVVEYVLSFFAYLPADDPEYAVLITLDEPVVGDAQSSTIAVPVVAALLEDIIPYLGIEADYSDVEEEENSTVMVPHLIDEKPHEAQISLRKLGLNTEIIGQGATVIKQIPENPTRLPKGGTVILYTDDTVVNSTTTVPNVVGKTAQEANQMIINAGLNISIQGQDLEGSRTVVVAQEPAGDSTAEIGSVVTVHFVEPPKEQDD